MKKILVLLVAMIMCFGLCACGEKTTTVEITNDNWEEYFEIVIEDDIEENAQGEAVEYWGKTAYLVLKDGYEMDVENTELSADVVVKREVRFVEEDKENNGFVVGEVYTEHPTGGYLDPEEGTVEIDSDKAEIGISYPSGERADGTIFMEILSSCEIEFIKGTLVVIEK